MNSYLRKYGVATTINFELYATDGIDLYITAADGGTDCNIRKDQGADATCTNDFVDEGIGYSLALTATEMQAAEITIYIIDSASKVYLDTAMKIETYGDASAQHAVDLDDAVRAGLTSLPNAAVEAAGGLIVSTLGTTDADDCLTATSVTVSDKTGFSLSTAGILAIWHQLTSAIVTASTIGKLLVDNVNATVSSRMAETSINTTGGVVDNVNTVDGNVVGSVGSVTGHTNQTGDSYALLNGADSEPAQGAPVHTASPIVKIANIFKFMVNKKTSTSSTISVFNSDESTVDHKSTISDDDTTYTEGEYKTGP